MVSATTVGWHEPVSLPELGIERAYAKIDTGADTSSLHGRDILIIAGGSLVEFTPPLLRHQKQAEEWPAGGVRRVRAPLADRRIVRSSNGAEEERCVVRTHLLLGPLHLEVLLTLTNREGMRFPLLIGRSALAGANVLVDPCHANLTTSD